MSTLQLPDEVWSRVVSIRCFQDRNRPSDEAHLWLELRRVNRTFANAVEKYNIDRYLRRAAIGFDFGRHYVQNPDRNPDDSDDSDDQIKLHMSAVFRFDGFDESNPRLAILADRECAPCFRGYIAQSLNDEGGFQVEEETFRIQHVLSLRHHVQEVPLIHMESIIRSDQDFMIKFDWRATLSVWWSEFKELEDDDQRNSDSNGALAESLRAQSQSVDGFSAAIKQLMTRVVTQRDAAFRRIRRKRITRLLALLDNLRLSEESDGIRDSLSREGEKNALKGIKAATTSLNFAEFSDDSEEESEEDMENRDLFGGEDNESEDDEYGQEGAEAGEWEDVGSDVD